MVKGGFIYMSKRGENIRKRKDGRWEARLIDFYKENGKAHYKSLYGKTYTEAKRKVKTYEKSSVKKVATTKKDINEVCEEWLDRAKMRLKESSYARYYIIVHTHILPYFKNYAVSAVTRETVERFIDYKLQKLSAKTVHDITSVLIQTLKYAERNRYIIDFNYNIDMPKIQTKEFDMLNYADEQKLNEYIRKNLTPENFGVLLTKTIGLRIGEPCALQRQDFDFEAGVVYINKTLQRVKNLDENATTKTKLIITTPKSQKSKRVIPLPESIISIAKKLYENENPEIYILTGTTNYIEPRVYQAKFKKLLESAGVRQINFHSLRHLFATRAIENGFDIKSLSEILGHSSVKFTLERYVHSSLELKRTHINRMAS